MPDSINTRVTDAVALFRTSPEFDDVAAFKALLNRGVSRQLAARLVEFVPMAYCRVLLRDVGVQFPDSFRRAGERSEARPLASEPVWEAAYALAISEVERGVRSPDVLMVAARSAEFQAVDALLNRGSKAKDVVLTVPVLPWPEAGPDRG